MSDSNDDFMESHSRINKEVGYTGFNTDPQPQYNSQYNYQPSTGMMQTQEDIPRGPMSPNVKGSTKPKPPPDRPRGQVKTTIKGPSTKPPPQTRGIPSQHPPQGGSYPYATGAPSNVVFQNQPVHYQHQPTNNYPYPSPQSQYPTNHAYVSPQGHPYGGHPSQGHPIYSPSQPLPPGPAQMGPDGFWSPSSVPQAYPPQTGPPPQGYQTPYAPPLSHSTPSNGSFAHGVGGFAPQQRFPPTDQTR